MKVKSLTEGNIYKNYILYALPLIVSSILARLYGTVDSVIAGKCIGDLALGAVSAMSSIDAIFFALFNGFSVGFSIHLANLFGQRNYARIRHDTSATEIFIAADSLPPRPSSPNHPRGEDSDSGGSSCVPLCVTAFLRVNGQI